MINNYLTFNSANNKQVIEDIRIPAVPNMGNVDEGAFEAYFEVLVNANGCPAFFISAGAHNTASHFGFD